MPPEIIDSLDRHELKPLLVSLLQQNAQLLARVDVLLARIVELEAKLGTPTKTPDNSHAPPSSGHKANVADAKPGKKKGRKGRPGVARALAANPDVTRDIYAERCACGTAMSPADQALAHAYDHIDLPVIKPITTRINLFRAPCPCCRKRVTATPPADMAPGSPFGPGIVSIAAYLHGRHMVGFERLVELFGDLLGLKLSEGAVSNMLGRAAKPFATKADDIGETVRNSPVIFSDETSARVCGRTWWQWLFASASAVYHTIVPTRGKCVPTAFLDGARPEVWISDRLAAQGHHAAAHQYCLAHLIRDAQYAT